MNKNNLITVFDPDDLKTMYDFNEYSNVLEPSIFSF